MHTPDKQQSLANGAGDTAAQTEPAHEAASPSGAAAVSTQGNIAQEPDAYERVRIFVEPDRRVIAVVQLAKGLCHLQYAVEALWLHGYRRFMNDIHLNLNVIIDAAREYEQVAPDNNVGVDTRVHTSLDGFKDVIRGQWSPALVQANAGRLENSEPEAQFDVAASILEHSPAFAVRQLREAVHNSFHGWEQAFFRLGTLLSRGHAPLHLLDSWAPAIDPETQLSSEDDAAKIREAVMECSDRHPWLWRWHAPARLHDRPMTMESFMTCLLEPQTRPNDFGITIDPAKQQIKIKGHPIKVKDTGRFIILVRLICANGLVCPENVLAVEGLTEPLGATVTFLCRKLSVYGVSIDHVGDGYMLVKTKATPEASKPRGPGEQWSKPDTLQQIAVNLGVKDDRGRTVDRRLRDLNSVRVSITRQSHTVRLHTMNDEDIRDQFEIDTTP